MSFDTFESAGGRPIEFYEFSYQGRTLRYTSADRDITIDAVTYVATTISRSTFIDTNDIAKATLTLTCEPHFEVSELFNTEPPDDVVGLVLKRFQNDDPAQEVKAIWLGRVVNCAWPTNQSTLRCESIYTALKQPGLRRPYSKNCTYVVYGDECQLDIGAFTTVNAIDSQTGNVINGSIFATQPDGFWAGGRIYWEQTPGFIVKRGIKNHVGSQIEITHTMPGLPPGATVSIVPGCDHTYFTCGNKFSNTDNYGGQPNMQQKNPFGSANVF